MGNWKGVDPAQWARDVKSAILRVKQGSVQELFKEMSTTIPNGGRVPVRDGNLARSLQIQLGTPVQIDASRTTFTAQDVGVTVLAIKGDEVVYLGYQAAYARRQNYGFTGTDSLGRTYNQSGHGFVEAARAKWQSIVEKVTMQVRQAGGL